MPVQAMKVRYTVVLHDRNKINVKERTIEITRFNWIEAELSSSISVHSTKVFLFRKTVHANIMHCNTSRIQ